MKIKKILLVLLISILSITNVGGFTAYAISQNDLNSIYGDSIYYEPNQNSSNSNCSVDTGGTLDAWMQATAIHESGGNPTANSGNGAYGKYQIIPSSWKGWATAYYPPALQYSTANLAPENVQDALTYLTNLANYKNFGGDPFWLAVNWYSPAADSSYPNKNAPILNTVPGSGNTETFAQYGNQIASAVSSGSLNGKALSSIKLSYTSAPDFQKYLAQDGGAPSSSPTIIGASSSSGCSGSNCTVPNGNSISGPNAAILCEAEKYNNIYYQFGGGHGYTQFRQKCPESAILSAVASSSASNPGPCATDCSGLVSVAVDAVYNQNFNWTVSNSNGQMTGSGSQYWESIPISQAQAGDIVTSNNGDGTSSPGTDGHVEIVEYVSGNMIYTFGSHSTGTKTGQISSPLSGWNEGAWRYTGPGTN